MMRNAIGAVVLTVLVLVGGAWIFMNYERVSEREHVGFQGEAARNPLLAAGRLLQRMGLAVRTTAGIGDIDALPRDATVIVARAGGAVTPERAARLLAWVERGGHLIVDAEWLAADDPLLVELGLRRLAVRSRPPARPSEVSLPHAPGIMRVYFGYRTKLEDPRANARWVVDDPLGLQLAQIERGRGLVSVAASLSFATNGEIARHDHAEFFWQLVRTRPQSRDVLVIPQLEKPALWPWLLDHAAAAVGIAGLLLLAWLWRITPRFGPIAPDPEPARKRLLDHLRASGRFQWGAGRSGELYAAARESWLRAIGRLHPDLATLAPDAVIAEVARRVGVPAERLLRAWNASPREPRQFVEAVRLLQSAEETLVRRPGRAGSNEKGART